MINNTEEMLWLLHGPPAAPCWDLKAPPASWLHINPTECIQSHKQYGRNAKKKQHYTAVEVPQEDKYSITTSSPAINFFLIGIISGT